MTICRRNVKIVFFKILKIYKIRTLESLEILILIRQLGKKYNGLYNRLEIGSYKGFR